MVGSSSPSDSSSSSDRPLIQRRAGRAGKKEEQATPGPTKFRNTSGRLWPKRGDEEAHQVIDTLPFPAAIKVEEGSEPSLNDEDNLRPLTNDGSSKLTAETAISLAPDVDLQTGTIRSMNDNTLHVEVELNHGRVSRICWSFSTFDNDFETSNVAWNVTCTSLSPFEYYFLTTKVVKNADLHLILSI